MALHLNCDVWADVNFGHGTVEIRCTKVGPHDHHACMVLLNDTEEEGEPVEHDSSGRRNVFERNG